MSNDNIPFKTREHHARDTADAERRRRALRQVLAHHDLRPAELAARIGLSTANVFYNFLNGHSESLSQRTTERILREFPDATTRELLIAPPERQPGTFDAPLGYRAVPIMAEARAGHVQPEAFLSIADRRAVLVPREPALSSTIVRRRSTDSEVLFAVRVAAPGAELLYPAGSVLICTPVPAEVQQLPARCRVVVAVPLGSGVEVTVREVRIHDQLTWFWLASTDPSHHEPALAAWHLSEGIDNGVRLLGRVIASWQPELPAPRD